MDFALSEHLQDIRRAMRELCDDYVRSEAYPTARPTRKRPSLEAASLMRWKAIWLYERKYSVAPVSNQAYVGRQVLGLPRSY
jgi:hypothetical protein